MDIAKALITLRPNAQWSLLGNTYDGLEWVDEIQTKPSEDEISQKIEELKAEHERTQYQRQRKPEYPSITDQLDALFHAGVFPPEMAEQIQAIKDKYPKPE
jgi:uncharacterized small protein (DUF1192 family)